MKHLMLLAALILSLSYMPRAHALCGDVTGDEQRSATDALAVLRSAVGQSVELICACEGPTELRLFNPFECGGETATTEARFNGLTFQAESFQTSDYQTLEITEISLIEIDTCGATFYFNGPVLMTPGRSMTFLMALLDPAVYQFPGVDVPAQFLIYDDGPAGSSLTAGDTLEPGGRLVTRMYGGTLR